MHSQSLQKPKGVIIIIFFKCGVFWLDLHFLPVLNLIVSPQSNSLEYNFMQQESISIENTAYGLIIYFVQAGPEVHLGMKRH